MIIWITALCNSRKIWAMSCRATQDGRVMVESSDKTWLIREGNDKPLQYSWLKKPMNSSVQFSHRVVSNSLQPHESQHVRPPCPSPTPGVHSDSCPSSQWCHPAISSSAVPFSSCPLSLLASESFPMSQLFVWGGLSTGVSALASLLPKKSQDSSASEWTGWISLQSKGLSRVFSNTTVQKHQFFCAQETHEQYEKAKRYDTRRWVPQGGKCPICHWGRVEKQFHKEWRSWTNAKMSLSCGVCLVVKVKSNAVKNSHV